MVKILILNKQYLNEVLPHPNPVHTDWWVTRSECSSKHQKDASMTSQLTFDAISGVFYILIGGIFIALIISIFENFICVGVKSIIDDPERRVMQNISNMILDQKESVIRISKRILGQAESDENHARRSEMEEALAKNDMVENVDPKNLYSQQTTPEVTVKTSKITL